MLSICLAIRAPRLKLVGFASSIFLGFLVGASKYMHYAEILILKSVGGMGYRRAYGSVGNTAKIALNILK